MNIEKDLFPEKYNKYMEMMNSESDRGSVLVSTAILDDTLSEMIKAKLVPSYNRNDGLISEGFSPLGSFAAKIEMAYRLGLIRENYKKSLNSLRKIRNDFAHASVKNGFDNQVTQQRIMNIVECNRNVIDAIVEAVALNSNNTSFELSDFIRVTSYRFLLEFIFSSMAAALNEQIPNIESIVELN